jgi:hypothetical protein
MQKKSKVAITAIVITATIGTLGYFQYSSITDLDVSIRDSKIVEQTNIGSLYQMQIEFENPSFMILNVGRTDFLVSVENENLGAGILEPFAIPAMGKAIVDAPFLADNTVLSKYNNNDVPPSIKLSGITRYNLLFTTLDVPFTYHPTQDEAREFIHGQ